MVKARTTISIDHELMKKAHESFMNISGLAEDAIRAKLKIKEVQILDSDKCEFCGRAGEKSTRDDLEGLSWLYPDERWICNTCLKSKGKNITK